MVFSSLYFTFIFLLSVLIIYFSIPNRAWKNIVLLITSLVFYAWGEPTYVFLMLGSILFNWQFGIQINRGSTTAARRNRLILGIVANLIPLAIFKYLAFFLTNLNSVFSLRLTIPSLSLPIGISFYTFMAISYLVDIYRSSTVPQRNPLYFGTYLSMFPHLVAGPIVRYNKIALEIESRRENLHEFSCGLRRFVVGLGKKVLIANTMGVIADTLFHTEPYMLGAIPAWFAVLAFTFQIYFDFSGYSDMAIGLARMFGFHFAENFDYPYISKSITEFWRRWHISLSFFFRDYVYIPLGGNRVGRFRWILNLAIVWGLTGLWHGASWNFVLWGLYFGVILGCEKLLWGQRLQNLPNYFQHAYALFLIVIGWLIFRVTSIPVMTNWFRALFGLYGAGDIAMLNLLNVLHYWPWFIIAALGSTPVARNAALRWATMGSFGFAEDLALMLVFVWSSVVMLFGSFNPFIYFRF